MKKIVCCGCLLVFVGCTGEEHFSPPSPMGTGVAGLASVLTGSAASGAVRTAGADFTPNTPRNVQILDEPPSWDYVEVGFVQSQHGPFITATGVYEALQWRAASIGADAVIVDRGFMKYTGRGDSFISRPVKGVAIARPENVDGGQISRKPL